ncbi:MAG: hypothetical protein ACYCYM_01705 [Saccharofermentanales bacterium]
MKSVLKKRSILLLLSAIILSATMMPVFAAQTKVIKITTNTDINPFIRFIAQKKTFNTGGPFTVHFDIKIENYKRMTKDAAIFINLHDDKSATNNWLPISQKVWKANTDGWAEDVKKDDGTYITFNNVGMGAIFDGVVQEYFHINFGAIYAQANVYFRNFRIKDSSGNVRYSFDTDPDLQGITDLKQINSEEPLIFGLTFGDGTGTFTVMNDDGSGSSSTSSSSGPIMEDPTNTPAASSSSKSSASLSSQPVSGGSEVSGDPSAEDSADVSGTESDDSKAVSEADSGAVSDQESSTDQSSLNGETSEPGDGPSSGTIAGIVIGAVVLVGAGVLGILYSKKKFPSQKNKQ